MQKLSTFFVYNLYKKSEYFVQTFLYPQDISVDNVDNLVNKYRIPFLSVDKKGKSCYILIQALCGLATTER